jgi:hypothetical protein
MRIPWWKVLKIKGTYRGFRMVGGLRRRFIYIYIYGWVRVFDEERICDIRAMSFGGEKESWQGEKSCPNTTLYSH